MKKIFRNCDRCEASLQYIQEKLFELELHTTTQETGENTYKPMELCDDCYTSLVKWMGGKNPFTGMMYVKP